MDKLIAQFSAQLLEALEIANSIKIERPKNEINHLVISGLGGSGIGGDLTREFTVNELEIPLMVNKTYQIPNFINKNTVVIISSYSGNTEETVEAMKLAVAKGAHVIGLTSGGAIAEYCSKNQLDCVMVPPNSPSPRACLGYSVVLQLGILRELGLIGDSFKSSIKATAALFDAEDAAVRKLGYEMALKLKGKRPILYCADNNEAVALRWRQQIAENSKQLSWHHVVPEMNHNELVGWRDENDQLAVIWLRNKEDYSRTQIRMDINQEITTKYTKNQMVVWSKGSSAIERAFYLIYVGDWMSYYLSQERGMDTIEVDVIDYLKGALAKK